MTETIISSPNREVAIGFDRPFVVIGERINPTGRKLLAAEMAAGDCPSVRCIQRITGRPFISAATSQCPKAATATRTWLWSAATDRCGC